MPEIVNVHAGTTVVTLRELESGEVLPSRNALAGLRIPKGLQIVWPKTRFFPENPYASVRNFRNFLRDVKAIILPEKYHVYVKQTKHDLFIWTDMSGGTAILQSAYRAWHDTATLKSVINNDLIVGREYIGQWKIPRGREVHFYPLENGISQ